MIALPLFLVACNFPSSAPASQPSTPTIPLPTPSPTTPPPSTLVVCLGQEPASLYPFGAASYAKQAMMEAIYDGPVDYLTYAYQPVILQTIPALSTGDAVLQPVTAKPGDQVVDDEGNLVTLTAGVKVRPSGCQQADCVQPYDGFSEIQMDQLAVTFKLLPGLKWSDAQPLTAADSVYAYNLAADPATPANKFRVDRTESYQAVDDATLQWIGKPGFLDANYVNNFWLPLPSHLWGTTSAADLTSAEISATKPVGWGPYIVDEWVKGDHIRLLKNPNYFRAQEGLPKFDILVYRFVGVNANQNLSALMSGECDVLDRSAALDEQGKLLTGLEQDKKAKVFIGPDSTWEQVGFGIKPASYDDVYNVATGDRPDIFGDVRVRQAFAYCMDRQAVIDQVLLGKSVIPDSFLAPFNPLVAADLKKYPFDVTEGSRLLDEVGWKDEDNDPATPRVARNVVNVPDGSLLEVNYLTTTAGQRQQVSALLVQSLAQCGIKADPKYMTNDELFAEGPGGPFFGRQFDLVQYTWGNLDNWRKPPCALYQGTQVPNQANRWNGVNTSGYANPEYDLACQNAAENLPGQPGYSDNLVKAQQLFAGDLPSVPLYQRLVMAATRPDLCGFKLDPTAASDLWNLERFGLDPDCNE